MKGPAPRYQPHFGDEVFLAPGCKASSIWRAPNEFDGCHLGGKALWDEGGRFPACRNLKAGIENEKAGTALLPLRIRLPIRALLLRAGVHIVNARIGLVNGVECIAGGGLPCIGGPSHGIHGDLFKVSFADQIV
jgi:hypothetical protein